MNNDYKKGVGRLLARALLGFFLIVGISFTVFAVHTVPAVLTEESTNPSSLETVEIEECPLETTPSVVLNDTPVTYPNVHYTMPVTYWEAVDHRDAILWYIDQLDERIESDEYTEDAVRVMLDEKSRLQADVEKLGADIDIFQSWIDEYPEATQVWFFFRSHGFSEEITAAIIGNMMIETSGGTLSLKPTIYGPGHYGLCQWSLYYKPFMADKTIEEQLEYLLSDMEYEFDTFGFCYQRGFKYTDFLNMTDYREAAIAFAKAYERPGPGTYNMRADCAEIAYSYFTNK